MPEILKQIVGYGLAPLIVAVLFWLIIETRVKKSISHEFDAKLEKLKVDLARSSTLAQAAWEQDKKTFETMNAILNESKFRDILSCISDHGFYELEDSDKLYELRRFGEKIENRFLDQQLRQKSTDFNKFLDFYLSLVANVFFPPNDNRDIRYKLYPELKHSDDEKDRAIFEKARQEIVEASDKLAVIYEEFRKEVKSTLFV